MRLIDHLQHEVLVATRRGDAVRAQALRNVEAGLQVEHGGSVASLDEPTLRRLLGRYRQRLVRLRATYDALGMEVAEVLSAELTVCNHLLPVLGASATTTLLAALAKQVHQPSVGRLLGALVQAAPGQVDVPTAEALARRLVS